MLCTGCQVAILPLCAIMARVAWETARDTLGVARI
jgi:hypothetical protein